MNGCTGMTDTVWEHVNVCEASQRGLQAAPSEIQMSGHALQSLSLVGCKSMRCCYMGLTPQPPAELSSPCQHLQQPTSWLPASCHLAGEVAGCLNVHSLAHNAICVYGLRLVLEAVHRSMSLLYISVAVLQ